MQTGKSTFVCAVCLLMLWYPVAGHTELNATIAPAVCTVEESPTSDKPDKTFLNKRLIAAVKNNDKAYVECLLIQGADSDCRITEGDFLAKEGNENSHTPLIQAVWDNNLDMAELLLKYGAQVNARGEYVLSYDTSRDTSVGLVFLDGGSALHLAVGADNMDMVKLLLKYKADINLKDNQEWTPLIHTSRKYHRKMVEFLLRAGAKQ